MSNLDFEEEPPRLVVMAGLPRSGKTTIVRNEYLPNGYAVVCPDDFRLALYGQAFIRSAEELVWASVRLAVDALLRSGNWVVLDSTCLSERSQTPWIMRGALFHVVLTSKEECISRAVRGYNPKLVKVIEKMADTKLYRYPPQHLVYRTSTGQEALLSDRK